MAVQFPIAVSLGFGILVATFILMLLVPALGMLQERSLALLRRAFGKVDMHEPATGDSLSPIDKPYLPAPKVGEGITACCSNAKRCVVQMFEPAGISTRSTLLW